MSQPAPFTTSPIDYPRPAWRYWLLFQSWKQLSSYILIILIGALAVQSLALLTGAKLLHTAMLLGAMALGGLVSVLLVMPARFTVSPSSEESVARVLMELKILRYVEVGVDNNAVVYRQGLPRLLRWDEGNVRLTRDGDDLVVNGPMANVRRMRSGLLSRN